MECKKRIIVRKEKIKIYQAKQNNKNKNKRVIYEALANKLRSSLLGDEFIYLILIIVNTLLSAKKLQKLTCYL